MPLLVPIVGWGTVVIGGLLALRSTVETTGQEMRKTIPWLIVLSTVATAVYLYSRKD